MATIEDSKNEDAATRALWRVAETDDIRRLESIVSQGADVNASNASGMTALMRAASRGRIRMVRALLELGADPNASRNDKFTPLMLAAFFGHEKVVRVLVEFGASKTAATRFGTSAQTWAAARTFQDVAHYLNGPDSVNKLGKERLEYLGKSSNKRFEGQLPLKSLAHQPEVASNIQPAKRRTTAKSLTTLLFVIAVIGGWAMRREQHRLQLNSQTHPNVAGVVVTPAKTGENLTGATISGPASLLRFTTIEEQSGYDVSGAIDKLPTKQPSVTRVIVSLPEAVSSSPSRSRKDPGTGARGANSNEPKPMATALAQNEKIPVDHSKISPSRQLPSMTVSPNSQPSFMAETTSPKARQAPESRATPKNAPAPITTQLISSPANSPSKGRAIQWP